MTGRSLWQKAFGVVGDGLDVRVFNYLSELFADPTQPKKEAGSLRPPNLSQNITRELMRSTTRRFQVLGQEFIHLTVEVVTVFLLAESMTLVPFDHQFIIDT